MKLKTLSIFLFLFVNLGCLVLLNPLGTAEQANVSIKDVTVQLLQTRPPVGTTIVREYRLTAILQNTGDVESVNITVSLRDPQPGLNATLVFKPEDSSIEPHEEKTFVFENWPTALSSDIALNISFQPSSPNVLLKNGTYGWYIYMLHIGGDTTKTSTPGFEILVFLIAMVVLLSTKKLRK